MQQNFGYMDITALRSGALRYRVRRLADPGKAPSPAADEIKPASKQARQDHGDRTMTNEFPTQIPAEMREFAGRSVAQARKAFEGFIGAVHKTAGDMDAATNSAHTGVKDAGSKAVAFAEKSVTSAFDLAEKLVQAKDVQEVLRLQAEYLQQQMAAYQEQARELGDAVQKAAGVKK